MFSSLSGSSFIKVSDRFQQKIFKCYKYSCIHVEGIFCIISGEDLVAVNDVTFRAFGGQIMALLGHNGAGKSTTFNILTGKESIMNQKN